METKRVAVKVERVAYNKKSSRLQKLSSKWTLIGLALCTKSNKCSFAVAMREPSQIPKCTLEPRDATESLPYSGLRLDSLTVIPPAENYPDTVSLFSKNILTASRTASAILSLHC